MRRAASGERRAASGERLGYSAVVRIPLPADTFGPDRKAHSYPFRIATQTHEFLQASAFHVAMLDMAAGERVRQENALAELQAACLAGGLDPKTWDEGWDILGRYKGVFESSVFQTVVISMRSHWDWYVRRLAEFVRFCRGHVASPSLKPEDEKALSQLGTKKFSIQIAVLERATGVSLMPTADSVDAITLMTHVRNLGIHNRWEVDQLFLDSHPNCGFQVGDLRLVQLSELEVWRKALGDLVTATAVEVGKRYVSAPTYP